MSQQQPQQLPQQEESADLPFLHPPYGRIAIGGLPTGMGNALGLLMRRLGMGTVAMLVG